MTSSSFPNLGDAICLPDNRPVITNRLPENYHKNQEPLSEALFGFGTLGNPPKILHVLTMQTHVPHLFFFSLTTSQQADKLCLKILQAASPKTAGKETGEFMNSTSGF